MVKDPEVEARRKRYLKLYHRDRQYSTSSKVCPKCSNRHPKCHRGHLGPARPALEHSLVDRSTQSPVDLVVPLTSNTPTQIGGSGGMLPILKQLMNKCMLRKSREDRN